MSAETVNPEELLTINEVCEILKTSKNTVYKWMSNGAGPDMVKMPNAGIRIRRRCLTEWLDLHTLAS